MQIELPYDEIVAFTHRWGLTEFSLFGSVLRDDFRPDSDIDVIVGFPSNSKATLFDMMDMEDELVKMFERSVDLLTRYGVEHSRNPFARKYILEGMKVIYTREHSNDAMAGLTNN